MSSLVVFNASTYRPFQCRAVVNNSAWILFQTKKHNFVFQAKALAEPFAYEEYRRAKIREKIDEERANRVKLKVSDPRS